MRRRCLCEKGWCETQQRHPEHPPPGREQQGQSLRLVHPWGKSRRPSTAGAEGAGRTLVRGEWRGQQGRVENFFIVCLSLPALLYLFSLSRTLMQSSLKIGVSRSKLRLGNRSRLASLPLPTLSGPRWFLVSGKSRLSQGFRASALLKCGTR